MTGQVTVTAKTGPNYTNTALVLTAVDRVDFDLGDGRVQVTQIGTGGNIKEYDLTGVTTVTCTISGGNYAFVVS